MVITTDIGLSLRVNRTCSSTSHFLFNSFSFSHLFSPSHPSPPFPLFTSYILTIAAPSCPSPSPPSYPLYPHPNLSICQFVVLVFLVVFVVGPASPGRRRCLFPSLTFLIFPLLTDHRALFRLFSLDFGSSLEFHSSHFPHFSGLFGQVSGSPLTRGA